MQKGICTSLVLSLMLGDALCQICSFLPGHVIPFMACSICNYTLKVPLYSRIPDRAYHRAPSAEHMTNPLQHENATQTPRPICKVYHTKALQSPLTHELSTEARCCRFTEATCDSDEVRGSAWATIDTSLASQHHNERIVSKRPFHDC